MSANMLSKRLGVFLSVLVVAAIGCGVTPEPTPAPEGPDQAGTNAALEATIQAFQQTESAATAATSVPLITEIPPTVTSPVVPTVGPQEGTISGHLSYPSEGIPPLRVVVFDANTLQPATFLDTQQDQGTYAISVAPGVYFVVAYYAPFNLAGGYTQAVPCGLTVSCADHSLIPVQVVAGVETTDIDPGDWYVSPGTFPSMP